MTRLGELLFGLNCSTIALYGLGTETLHAIDELQSDFTIIGLLDSYKTNGFQFGLPIIELYQCIEKRVEAVIVVARPGSCKAIARNIGDFCINNGILLIDVRGKNLLEEKKTYYDFDQIVSQLSRSANRDAGEDFDRPHIRLFLERLSKILEDGQRKGAVCIRDAYDIGYLFCAPLITDFVFWIQQMAKERGLSHILFCGRDGYLLKQLYQMLDNSIPCSYFLTSRTAAVRSGVEDISDLEYVDSMKFSGTLEQNMLGRFGIDIRSCRADSLNEKGILKYKQEILARAEGHRKAYLAYLDRLGCRDGNVAFVDFVAKGTTQYFIGKFFPGHLTGLYFLRLEPQFMEDKALEIHPFFGDAELEQSSLFDSYYIMETILTSPDPSLLGFAPTGEPLYAAETRSDRNIECVKRIQDGITDYFQKYIGMCGTELKIADKELDDKILEIIHHVKITDQDFQDLTVEDPFFNRQTGITDVL